MKIIRVMRIIRIKIIITKARIVKSLFLIIALSLIGCNFNKENSERTIQNKDTARKKENATLTISKKEQIYYGKLQINYCNLQDSMQSILRKNSVNNSFVDLKPDLDVDMGYVKCVIKQLRCIGIDSIRLWSKNNYILTDIGKNINRKTDFINVRIMKDNNNVIIGKDKILKKRITECLKSKIQKDVITKVILFVEKGVSYNSYVSVKDTIESLILKINKKENSKIISLSDNECPYCGI